MAPPSNEQRRTLMKSESIFENILVLESDLSKAKAAMKEADKALASAYAKGGDSTVALKAATEARDRVSSLIAALPQADRQWFEAATAERDGAIAEVWARRDKAYADFSAALAEALPEIRKPLARVMTGQPLESALKDFQERAETIAWEALSEVASKEFDSVPAVPAARPERGANGLPKRYESGVWKDVLD